MVGAAMSLKRPLSLYGNPDQRPGARPVFKIMSLCPNLYNVKFTNW